MLSQLTIRSVLRSSISLSLSAIVLGSGAWFQRSLAADFSHAQKIFVPATRIDRRLDYQALSDRAASIGPSYGASSYNYSSYSAKPGPSGLVPPPPPSPPVNLASGLVPPPPPALPLVPASTGRAASLPPKRTVASQTKPQNKSASREAATSSASISLRQKAQQLIKEGKLEEADIVLRDGIKTLPKDNLIKNDLVNLSLERAQKFLSVRDLDSASKAAREALFVNPSSGPASQLLDNILRQSSINPQEANERLKLANLFSSQGRDTAATVEYRQALKLKASAEGHVGLGNLAARANNKSLAKEEYQKALEINPNSGAAHRQIGMLSQEQGDLVGANTDLSRALVLDPSDKLAGKSLVELWQKQVSKSPGEANSHMGLARAYQLAGDLKSAQGEYRQVVRIDPDHPNLEAARQSFKLALSRQEAERAVQAARTLESQGAVREADQKLVEALALSPTDTQIRLYHGSLQERLGQASQAHDTYMSVLKDDPSNVEAAQRLMSLGGRAPQIAPPASRSPSMPLKEGPPGPSPPRVTADPVAQLSNFLVALRNHTISEKQRMQDIEEQAHQTLRSIARPATQANPTQVASAAAAASAEPAIISGLASTTISALPPGNPAISALPGAAEPARPGLVSRLAAAALPGTASELPPTAPPFGGPIPATSAGESAPLISSGQPVGAASVDTPDQAAALLRGPLAKPIAGSSMPSSGVDTPRIVALEQQNQALSQQLQQAQQAIQGLQQTLSTNQNPLSSTSPGLSSNQLMGTRSEAGAALAAPTPSPTNEYGALDHSAQPPAYPNGVRLELIAVQPSKSSIDLKVILKNDQQAPLKLPASPRALLRNGSGPEARLKVSFPTKVVPAYGQIDGTISVPAGQLTPAADLVLPDLLPPGSSSRDIHLTAAPMCCPGFAKSN